jgi:lipopolysaccharide export system permease protein
MVSAAGASDDAMSPLRATRIDRYVFRQLLVALVATAGGLAALIWLTQSLHFVELVVDRGLSLRVFLELTGLLIPGFVAVILPITTFVVVQFVYQRLMTDRELTVMRAAGLSPIALSRPALGCGLLVMICCFVLDIWVVPASYHEFRTFQFEIRNRMAAFLLQEGVFTPISNQMTVYVRSRTRDGILHGILVEDDRQTNSRATILAERGRIVDGVGGEPDVALQNGSREEIDRQTGRLNVLTFDQNTISLASSSKGDNQEFRDATEMSIPELLHPDPRVTLARDRGKFLVEANRRLTAPFTAMSFALVALVSVLSGAFSRHGNIVRPAVAIGVVVALLALGLVIQNLAARMISLIPLIWIYAILPGVVASVMLYGPELRRAGPRRVAA